MGAHKIRGKEEKTLTKEGKIPSLTLVKVKNGYKSSNYVGCSHSLFRNDLCYFFVSSVLVLFIMLRIVDFEINS